MRFDAARATMDAAEETTWTPTRSMVVGVAAGVAAVIGYDTKPTRPSMVMVGVGNDSQLLRRHCYRERRPSWGSHPWHWRETVLHSTHVLE